MTPDEFKKQMDIGFTVLLGPTFKQMVATLRSNEKPFAADVAIMGDATGVLCCTNERVLYVSKLLAQITIEELLYDKITSVDVRPMTTSTSTEAVAIHTLGGSYLYTSIRKKKALAISQYIRERMAERATAASPAPAPAGDDIYAQLEKLASLKEKGIISEDEFNAKKKQLLGV